MLIERFQLERLSSSNSNNQLFNKIKIFSCTALIAFGAGPLITEASARGRSFPIEVTGTITSVDGPSGAFTIQGDEPAESLTIALRYDCKFTEHGASAGRGILKKGARVKVSYFSTIFTGNLAIEIEANPKAELVHGVIERIEPSNRRLTLRLDRSRCFAVRWADNALFINRGRTITPAKLREGTVVNVSYYSPAFESKYAVKVEVQPPF
jgi:hypothetical protein